MHVQRFRASLDVRLSADPWLLPFLDFASKVVWFLTGPGLFGPFGPFGQSIHGFKEGD